METLYWSCLAGGALFALVSVLLGDVLSDALDGLLDFLSLDVLKPMVIASAATVFGGAGILITRYTDLNVLPNIVLSSLIAIGVTVIIYLAYIRPMENSENSTGYSMKELPGRIGEVTVPIPAVGYGEVMLKLGASNILQIAASFEERELPAGTRVVVVEVFEDVLRVTEFEEK